MQLAFSKMHGTGNRILVVDARDKKRLPPGPETLRKLGDENTGPGFDQLMWLEADDNAAVTAAYRVFNADGSEVEQCGNGVRCVGWLLAQEDAQTRSLLLSSPAGLIEARIDGDRVAVSMGAPIFSPQLIPFDAPSEMPRYELQVGEQTHDVAVLSMGNPHCVVDVADTATAPVDVLGPAIEHHQRFPERCNVGFMAVRARQAIDLRVFERGVGETLACGTGACAAVVAAHRDGRVDDDVQVNLPGGQLVVSWRGGADTVWLTGTVELISEGTIDL